MLTERSPTHRFWLTIYSFPALVPAIVLLAFEVLVRKDLVDALGTQGSIIASRIFMALSLSTIVLIILANLMAIWHERTGRPAIPPPRL